MLLATCMHPAPVPFPTSLVVKRFENSGGFCSGIPTPVSLITTSTWFPTWRVLMVTTPFPSMAWAALTWKCWQKPGWAAGDSRRISEGRRSLFWPPLCTSSHSTPHSRSCRCWGWHWQRQRRRRDRRILKRFSWCGWRRLRFHRARYRSWYKRCPDPLQAFGPLRPGG